MLAAIVLLAHVSTGQTASSTRTSTEAPPVRDLAARVDSATIALDAPPPLSDEDLALIDAISSENGDGQTTGTSTPARPGPFELVHLGRGRIRAAVPRSFMEALHAEPSSIVVRRSHVSGDDLVYRGRSGPRLDVRLDGLPLSHALTRFDDHTELGMIDPWMLDRITIGGLDRVELRSVMPEAEPQLDTYAAAIVRSADRSTGAEATAVGSLGPVGLALMGGYADFGELRTDASHDAEPWAYQRANLRARARALGGPGDRLALTAGFDIDRLTNVETRVLREERRMRTGGFVDGRLGLEWVDAWLLLGLQGFDIEPSTGARQDVTTFTFNGGVTVKVESRELTIDASIDHSDAGALGSGYTGGAGGSARVNMGSLDLRAGLHWIRGRVETADRAHHEDGLTGFGDVKLWIGDEIHVSARGTYGFRMPTVADTILLARPDVLAERYFLLEAGPSFSYEGVELGTAGWLRYVDRAIEPLQGGLATYVEDVWMGGVDAKVTWRPITRLALTLAAGVTASDRVLAAIPGLAFGARARWQSSPEGWHVELHARGHGALGDPSPAETLPPGSLSKAERREWDRVVLGLRGVLPIAAGFAVTLALENGLDTRQRGYGGAIVEPGIDLRAALSHAW